MNEEDSVLIFGSDEAVAPAPPADTLSSRRVSIETLKANMAGALAAIGGMAEAAQGALDSVQVTYMDVELAIGLDGSVGLLGSGMTTSLNGTVTVRIEPRR